MKAEIWHARNPSFRDDMAIDFPQGFVHVADLEVANLDQAFHDSNNISSTWVQNRSVTHIYGSVRLRSTSVGDVVKLGGVPYLCASVGWKNLTNPEAQQDDDDGGAPNLSPKKPGPRSPLVELAKP